MLTNFIYDLVAQIHVFRIKNFILSFGFFFTCYNITAVTDKCLPCFVLMENPSLVNASFFLLIPWTLPYVAMCGYLLLNNKKIHAMKI